MMKYRCPHCGRVVERKKPPGWKLRRMPMWIKSYCDKTDKLVHLQRVAR
jgi:hypothetical protein